MRLLASDALGVRVLAREHTSVAFASRTQGMVSTQPFLYGLARKRGGFSYIGSWLRRSTATDRLAWR